ncbi:winged helix-turn-helix transcriptional regulator [Streptomyces sp. NPDC056190]|uniref:winged helix-turn-helix transcriptional regulator n=1 Tax=unclassified Streptomyces TaxID=2593676 RepID=UPI0035D664BC
MSGTKIRAGPRIADTGGARHRPRRSDVTEHPSWHRSPIGVLSLGAPRWRSHIPQVTQKSLTATLRRLERNGVIEREVVSTRPVAIRHRISPLGKTLRPPIDVLLAWASENMPAITRAREAFDTREEASR